MLVDAPVKCPVCAQHDMVNLLSLEAHGRVTCRNCGALIDFITQELVVRTADDATDREVARSRKAFG